MTFTGNGEPLRKQDWEVRDCTHSDAISFIIKYHYAKGGSNTGVYFHGLYRKGCDELLGVAWWLPPTKVACISVNPEHWRQVISLTRLAIAPDVPSNACSFLMGQSIKRIRKDGRFVSLVTYADEAQGHLGHIYKASNWTYVGRTGPYPAWHTPSGRQVATLATKTRTKAQMLELGYKKVGTYYKHKYVMHLSNELKGNHNEE